MSVAAPGVAAPEPVPGSLRIASLTLGSWLLIGLLFASGLPVLASLFGSQRRDGAAGLPPAEGTTGLTATAFAAGFVPALGAVYAVERRRSRGAAGGRFCVRAKERR